MRRVLVGAIVLVLSALPAFTWAGEGPPSIEVQNAVGVGGNVGQQSTSPGTSGNTNQNANQTTVSPKQSLQQDSHNTVTNLPNFPGMMGPLQQFTQPFIPKDGFLNGQKFAVEEMTLAEADDCRSGSATWYGGDKPAVDHITLFYDSAKPPVPMSMKTYVGTAQAVGKDKPWVAVFCEAAYKAMRNGVTHALVAWVIRPENATSGIGIGSGGAFSGLPVNGMNPYAVGAIAGFGIGWASVKVKGEAMVELTGFRQVSAAAAPAAPRALPSRIQPTPSTPAPAAAPSIIKPDGGAIKRPCGGAYDPEIGKQNWAPCK